MMLRLQLFLAGLLGVFQDPRGVRPGAVARDGLFSGVWGVVSRRVWEWCVHCSTALVQYP